MAVGRQSKRFVCAAAVVSALAAVTAHSGQSGQSVVRGEAEAIRQIEQPRDAAQPGLAAKTLQQLLADLTTPSVSIAVVKDYQIVLAKAWGYRDVESHLDASAETLYQAASISKPVAAMG